MDKKKVMIDNITGLLLLKVQYEKQFEMIQRITENERWDQIDNLKSSISRGMNIVDRMQGKLTELNDLLG